MKKIILPFAIAAMLGHAAAAQKFDYGIKAGLNIATLKISFGGLSGTSDDLYSFHGGLYGVLKVSDKFGIQPEVIYSAQGAAGSGGSGSFSLGYLSLPVMARFQLATGFNVQAGPQLSFLMNASIDGTDVKEAMNTVDFGLGFGVGVDRPSGVSFGFRYVLGLTNTLSSTFNTIVSGFGFPDITMTNQVMQFSVGYKLSRE